MAEHDERANGICFERILPEAFTDTGQEKALAENPANASPLEAAAIRSKLWRPGRTLRIRFLEGNPDVQDKIIQVANEWTKHANIIFDFGDHADAEIRIAFMPNQGYWSAVGTDALVDAFFPASEPTMNYEALTPTTPDRLYSRYVLHEFGHALGMIHEHQSAARGLQWNRDAVVKDLSGPPNNWDLATIEYNVFRRYRVTQTQFTKFDEKSIMLYSFPKYWTVDGFSSPPNDKLSDTDKTFIAQRYPRIDKWVAA